MAREALRTACVVFAAIASTTELRLLLPIATGRAWRAHIYMWWQPAARGHRGYTDLSAARSGAGTVHSLQPCQLEAQRHYEEYASLP